MSGTVSTTAAPGASNPFADALAGGLSSFGALQKQIMGLDYTKTANTRDAIKQVDDLWSTLSSVNSQSREASGQGVDDDVFKFLTAARGNLSNWNTATQAQDNTNLINQQRDDIQNALATNSTYLQGLNGLDAAGFTNAKKNVDALTGLATGVNDQASKLGLGPALDNKFFDSLNTFTKSAQLYSDTANTVKNQISTLSQLPTDLTIKNAPGIKSALENLTSLQKGVAGMSNMGGSNLAPEQVQLNTALAKAQDLQQQRTSAEKQATDFYSSLASAFQRSAPNLGGVDMRNGAAIDAAQNYLNTLTSSTNEFKSPLDAEYLAKLSATVDPLRAQVQSPLDALKSSRAGAIAKLLADVQGLSSGVEKVELTDDAELQRRLNEANRLKGELATFTGSGDIQTANSTFDGAQAAISGRIKQLYDRRTDIEKRSADLLAKSRGTNYSDLSQIPELAALIEQLKAESGTYKASAADDELAALLSLLNSTRGRLTTDRENLLARQAMDRAALEKEVAARSQASATPNWLGTSYGPLNSYGPNTPVYASNSFSRALGAPMG